MTNSNSMPEKLLKLLQIENGIKDVYLKITKPQKISFFTALFYGIIVHIIPLTNLLWNHDSTLGSIDPTTAVGWLASQGKWLIESVFTMEGAGSVYHTNFKLFVSLVFLAASSVLVVEICNIQSGLFAATVGAFMASFPGVMAIFLYDITVYLWIAFFAFLCIFLQYRHPGIKGGIVSTILLILTLGAYPPYITIVASGYILLLLQDISSTQKKAQEIFLSAIRLLIQLLAGIGGYYTILQALIKAKKLELLTYLNVDQMAHIEFLKLPGYIKQAYKEVWMFFMQDANGSGMMKWLYRFLILILLASIVFIAFKKRIYRDPHRLMLFVLLILLFPLAMNLTTVIDKGVGGAAWHMKYAFVMIPILTIKYVNDSFNLIKQNIDEKNISIAEYAFAMAQQWGTVILCFFIIYRWSVTCSEGYLRTRISYEKDYALLTNVVDDLYEINTMGPDKEIFFVYGRIEGIHGVQNITNELLPQLDSYNGVPRGGFTLSYDGVFERYLYMILGIEFQYADAESKEAILQTEEYAQMPCYPYEGYIQEINDILVVKLNG